MNREFYTLLFASLVFVACNTTQPTAKVLENKKSSIVESAKKEIVEQKSMLESVTKVAKKRL